jgi:hypothetical protein
VSAVCMSNQALQAQYSFMITSIILLLILTISIIYYYISFTGFNSFHSIKDFTGDDCQFDLQQSHLGTSWSFFNGEKTCSFDSLAPSTDDIPNHIYGECGAQVWTKKSLPTLDDYRNSSQGWWLACVLFGFWRRPRRL